MHNANVCNQVACSFADAAVEGMFVAAAGCDDMAAAGDKVVIGNEVQIGGKCN